MVPAALACLLLAAAPDPTSPATGTITVSGTFTLPPGSDFIEVEVRAPKWYRDPAAPFRVLIATVDRSVKPHKWTARGENFEPGQYLLLAVLHFEGKDGKGADETWDHRRVVVPGPAKK